MESICGEDYEGKLHAKSYIPYMSNQLYIKAAYV